MALKCSTLAMAACACTVGILLSCLVAANDKTQEAKGFQFHNGLRPPVNMTGQLGAAPFRIIVPVNWKGVLIVGGHGYIAKFAEGRAIYPFELGTDGFPTKEEQEPYVANVGGYAIATTKYSSEGWSIQEALKELPQLTSFFRREIAPPVRTIITGGSMSAITAIALAEDPVFSGPDRLYNGAFAFCGINAGTSETVNYLMTAAKAYDATFGISPAWGTAGLLAPNLYFSGPNSTDPAQIITFQADVPPSANFFGWVFGHLFFTFQVRWDIQTRAGGAITGTDADFVYDFNEIAKGQNAEQYSKDTFGLDPAPYLDKMNAAPKIIADPQGRAYAASFEDFTGQLQIPIITMHNKLDGQVRTSHESFYQDIVQSAGKSELLFQTYVDTYPNLFIGSNGPIVTSSGHCIFTKEQMLAAFNALDDWVAKGERPVPSKFAPAGGFVFNFTPLPWSLS